MNVYWFRLSIQNRSFTKVQNWRLVHKWRSLALLRSLIGKYNSFEMWRIKSTQKFEKCTVLKWPFCDCLLISKLHSFEIWGNKSTKYFFVFHKCDDIRDCYMYKRLREKNTNRVPTRGRWLLLWFVLLSRETQCKKRQKYILR